MTNLIKERSTVNSNHPLKVSIARHDTDPSFNLTTSSANTQLALHKPTIRHAAGAGINPLVDAAAFIFSSLGQVKSLPHYLHVGKLQKELIAEINTFQETAKKQGYSPEYILVARYAICATLDDVISHTAWGKERWVDYTLMPLFNQNQETPHMDNFFLILERIVKEPHRYIDVMELMYICLSLGYEGNYRLRPTQQLDGIRHSLYKHIKIYHGDIPKSLSPLLAKSHSTQKPKIPKLAYWFTFFMTASVVLMIFIGLGYLLEHISTQLSQALLHMGNFSSP